MGIVEKAMDRQTVLVYSRTNDGTAIGGYTKVGWEKGKHQMSDYAADKDAFVFCLQSASIINHLYQMYNKMSNHARLH